MPGKLYSHLATGSYFLGLMASLIYTATVLTVLIATIREPDLMKSGPLRESPGPTLSFIFLYTMAAAVIGFLIGLTVVCRTNLAHTRAVHGMILSSLVLIPTAIITLFIAI